MRVCVFYFVLDSDLMIIDWYFTTIFVLHSAAAAAAAYSDTCTHCHDDTRALDDDQAQERECIDPAPHELIT